jgi:hypothetical protein
LYNKQKTYLLWVSGNEREIASFLQNDTNLVYFMIKKINEKRRVTAHGVTKEELQTGSYLEDFEGLENNFSLLI